MNPSRISLIVCFLILLLWGNSPLRALDPNRALSQYGFHLWDMKSGLPCNTIYTVCQTRDGYLWIGTEDGLVRFDGLKFTRYNRTNVPQLTDNVIRALFQDRTGTLWIGSLSGGLTCLKDGRFTTYSSRKYQSLSKITAINEDHYGNLWIGSLDSGLTCVQHNRFTNYNRTNGLPSNTITHFYRDRHNHLWVVTASGIVGIQAPGTFEPSKPLHTLNYFHTTCIAKNNGKDLWIGTGRNGLIHVTHQSLTSYGIMEGLPNSTITALAEDREKNLWIGTDGGGLVRMTRDTFGVLPHRNELNTGFVSTIYQDNENNLWIGTLDGGLFQLSDSRFITHTKGEGLAHDYALCVHEDRSGNLWAGTNGGLCQLKNGIWKTVLTPANGLADPHVMALNKDRSGNLWIGTWAGLQRFNGGGSLQTFTEKNGLSDHRITAITTDRQGTLWVGTPNGLNRFDAGSNRFVSITESNGFKGKAVCFIFQNRRGHLLVGADAFTNRIDPIDRMNGGAPFCTPVEFAHPKLDKFIVRCAYEDTQDTLWLGTDSGLVRCRGKQSQWMTVDHGLNENNIVTITEDAFGYLWLAGRNGVSKIRKSELNDFFQGKITHVQPQTYNEDDGMKSRWCTGAGLMTRDGRAWFPTGVGIAMTLPHRTDPETRTVPVIIEEFRVDGNAIDIAGQNNDPITLSPGKKKLEFYYTAASFIHAQKIAFRTKLEGYDTRWVDRENFRTSTYTELSPGTYTFKILGRNAAGIWNQQAVSLRFDLKPYFYQTTGFYILMVIVITLIGYGGYRWRVGQLKHKARELAELVNQRTSALEKQKLELEDAHRALQHNQELIEFKNRQLEDQSEQLKELDKAKSRFFANISHEFRTPLTLIIGPLEQALSKSPDIESKAMTELMLRNSKRLLNLVDQLLELARSDSGKLKLKFVNQNIAAFIKSIFFCFQSLAQQREIAFTFHCEQDEIFAYYDREQLERIITNLLSNAFNYTQKGGSISVSVKTEPASDHFPSGSLSISVQDTGTGIRDEHLPHIFDRFYRGGENSGYLRKGTGIGLALTKDLVELHHGRIHVSSNCNEGEDRGTCFTVQLPLGSDHLTENEKADSTEGLPSLALARMSVNEIDIRESGSSGPESQRVSDEQETRPILLIVEDNADVRAYIQNALASHFQIEQAGDGEEGINQARALIPDLIISDIMMPKTDGYELCKILKTDIATSHIPIILLTAKTDEANVLKGLSFGADDYITKPFNTLLLAARVQNLIDLRRQLQLKRQRQLAQDMEALWVVPADEDFFRELTGIIDAHIDDVNFNVQVLGNKMGMGRTSLFKKIQSVTGKSPNQLIRNYRLQRAAQLLKTMPPDSSIADVASGVGFTDFSHFSQCFKKRFGQNPTHFRDMYREKGPHEMESLETMERHERSEQVSGIEIGESEAGSAPENGIILIIEDDPDARRYIRETLEPEFGIEEAENGDEGIQKAFEIIPDLIVSDVMMSGADGFELCRTLKTDPRTGRIPIVLLTARVSDESMISGFETGADDYITKPFNRDILRVRIKNLLNLRRHPQSKKGGSATVSELPQSSVIDDSFFEDLQKAIEKHLDEVEFSVDDLSKELYMGRSTLYRKILALSGETPSEFIRSYRLKRAAQLLKRKAGSVLDIALEVGFSSSSYFTQCFKEKFHKLPSEYLEEH
ncbi:MAG: two-component regulator propeller domain-containing protein [Candidatus Omnitrophota bacterium]